MNADLIESSSDDFLRRTLRWLATVCVAYALVSLANHAIVFMAQGRSAYALGYNSSLWTRVNRMAWIFSLASLITLLLGGLGLLKWKRWSRVVLWWASASMIGFSLVTSVVWFLVYSTEMRRSAAAAATTTTRIVGPPLWFHGSTMLISWLTSSAFPAIVLWVMNQRDVAVLWARRGEGFDVVPMAKAVGENGP